MSVRIPSFVKALRGDAGRGVSMDPAARPIGRGPVGVAFGLCGGYLDLLLMLFKKFFWQDGHRPDRPGFPLDRPGQPRGPVGVPRDDGRRLEPAPAGTRLDARGIVAVRDARDLGGPAEVAALRRLHLLLAAGLARLIGDAVAARRPDPRRCDTSLAGLLGAAGRPGGRSRRAGRRSGNPARWPDCRHRPPGARNVILIVWDTVRAYDLGALRLSPGYHPQPVAVGAAGRPVSLGGGAGPVDLSLAQLLLHRPVAVPAQYPVEVHARHPGSDPGRVPGLAGLSDRRVRGEHPVLQLRDRAGPRLRPFRGLPADAAVPARPRGPRELDPDERPVSRPLLRR